MNSIIKQNKDLAEYIKSIILKYCPYVEDRLYFCGKANSPEFDIEISINHNQSLVRFLFGTSNFKEGINEYIIIPNVIEFETIEEIIDFILEDHESVKNINLYNNAFELSFAINWTEQSIKGINCGDIRLNVTFNNIELKKQYSHLLIQKYYTFLEYTPSFKRIKNEYINSIKQSYFNTLDKMQLISLLNKMNEKELKELLYNLDNDVFIKYTIYNTQQPKVKKMFLK